jgi:enoyl-CoA hydratase
MPSSQPLATATQGAVTTVRIDDPQSRNALSDPVLGALAEALESADRDDGVRCVVVAGSDKVFASGADIRALLERDAVQIYGGDRARHWDVIRRVRTPLVAAVSGFCLGAGCELAMMCDVVIASETARFGLPETQLGLIPGAGGTQHLPRAIGKAKAMDVILTGRLLDAAEAERAGLVSRVVGRDDWLDQARAAAATIAERPAVAQRLAKEAVQAASQTALEAGFGVERRAFAITFATADAREGLTAFLEKRRPRFTHD